MSRHDKRTQNGPSVVSIVTGAGLVLGSVAVAWWVISGSGLDGRHVAGYAGWMLLAALLTGQTAVRLADWTRAAERRREAATQAPEPGEDVVCGTWSGDAPGMMLWVTLRGDQFWVKGWLSEHWQVREERLWWLEESCPLRGVLREIEDSGEMSPTDDDGTRFIRALLDLGAWPVPSFDEIERDWGRRDGDTQVVAQTA